MKRVMTMVEESARDWGVSPRVAWLIFWLPIAGALFIGLARVNRHFYDLLTQEDGPIEWGQFIFYALACVSALGVALRRFQSGYRWQGLMFAGLALGLFFIAGEEIAWGQRILGLQTPEELREINHQGEITVHNIRAVQNAFNFVMFLGGAYGTIAYFLGKRLDFARRWDQAGYLFVPPLFSVSCWAILFGYKLIRYTVIRTSEFTVTRYAEWPELCLAFALFLFTWLNYRRLAAQAKPALAPALAGKN
jgi:hypothetical protein